MQSEKLFHDNKGQHSFRKIMDSSSYYCLLLTICTMWCFFLLSPSPTCAWDNDVVHHKITQSAINYVYTNLGLQEIYDHSDFDVSSDSQCSFIDEGSVKEDHALMWGWDIDTWGMIECWLPNLSWTFHGYNPLTETGWGDLSLIDAVDYAIGIWQSAIDDYHDDRKEEAYFKLGRICHLLEDMSSPAHTQTDFHGVGDGNGEENDDAEDWGKANYISGSYNPTTICKPSEDGYTDINGVNYSDDTFENFMKNLAWETYFATTYQGKLVTEFGDVQPDSELKRMFPDVGYENDWYNPDYWVIPEVGWYFNGIGNSEWWKCEGNNTDGTGYYYLENLDQYGGGPTYPDPGEWVVPHVRRISFYERIYDGDDLDNKLVSNSTPLPEIYGSELFPRAAEWVAGLLVFFSQEVDEISPTGISRRHGTDPSTNIYVTFSEDMDDSTFTNSTITVSGLSSGTHSCSFSFNHSSYELTIDPSSNFTYSETVTVTIGTSVQDLAGNGLASPYVFTFTIESAPGPDPTSLDVTATLTPDTNVPADWVVNVNGTAIYNTGGSVPVGTVTIDTGENVYTAAVDDGVFNRNIHAPSSDRNISITVDDDQYEFSSTIYRSIDIKGDEGGAGYTLYRTTTCRDVQGSDPYEPIYETEFFRRSDTKVVVWLHFTYLYRSIRAKWEFYEPDGTLHVTEISDWTDDPQAQGYEYYYWWKLWAQVDIDGYLASYRPGRWTCKIYVDDGGGWDYKKTEFFTIGYEFTEHRMAKDVQISDPYMLVDETNVFYQTDSKALTWANADNVTESFDVKWEYYEPNGSLYDTYTFITDDPGSNNYYEYYRFWGWTDINGYLAASKCGDWYVDVFIRDAGGSYQKIYTDYFQILENPAQKPDVSVTSVPAVPIEGQSINLDISVSDNTYLKKVTLYWNDGSWHNQTWDNIYASSSNLSYDIGSIGTGEQTLEYYAVAWDTSGNKQEGEHQTITIQPETVTTPNRPSGDTYLQVGQNGSYSTGGASTNLGHSVEYQFDWGDGTQSSWGSATQSHSWSSEGYYFVKARARCQTHTNRESNWSSSLMVTVDSTNPVIEITTNDGDNFSTNEPQIVLEGLTYDPEPASGITSTTINTGDSNEGSVTSWRFTINLAQGPNTLTVTAIDNAGNVGTDTITITLLGDDTTPPYTSGHDPLPDAIDVPIDTNIVVHVQDDSVGVDQATISMTVDGIPVSPIITGTPADYTVTYDPPTNFGYEQVINVTVDASDLAGNPMTTDAYSFTTEPDPCTHTEKPADVNGDGCVDEDDLTLVGDSFGCSGDSGYDDWADINGDCCVDILDVIKARNEFTCGDGTCQSCEDATTCPEDCPSQTLCTTQTDIPQIECEALVTLYNSTDGPNWSDSPGNGWNQTTTPCSWTGITCSGGYVTEIDRYNNNLNGTIPSELDNLTNLQYLSLGYNQLSGSIPSLDNLTNLQVLSLHNNQLSGSIPSLDNLTNLQVLYLHNNQLSGSIPALDNLTNLQYLSLGYNQLNGSIPSLDNLTNLQHLYLYNNQLSGSIPSLGSLTNLQRLNLYNNQLSGSIPSLDNLSNLQVLYLQNNQLSGSIPSLDNLSNLQYLSLCYNQLNGTIPSSFVTLSNLTFLDLGYNMLTASDPALLTWLETFDPDWDETQTVPPEMTGATALSETSVLVEWTPILYTGDGGRYQVKYTTTSGGPYTNASSTTPDKTASSYEVTGLSPSTMYYFVVETFTPAHGIQQNDLTSPLGAEVSVQTQATPDINVKQGTTDIPSGTGSYDCGTVDIDSSISVIFTIENAGPAVLTLNGSPMVQIDPGNFSVTQQPFTDTLIPGGSVTFEITFTPGTTGTHTAMVSIANTDADENPYTFTILGEAYEPGDINGDGLINIFDLQLVINCILGSGSCERCDLNDDGLYNIFDLQLVINEILAP